MNARVPTLAALVLAGLLAACGNKPESSETQATAESLDTLVLAVNGMTCEGCVETVTLALKRVPEVRTASVSLADGHATVVVADGPGEEIVALVAAVTAAGYTVDGQEGTVHTTTAGDATAEPPAGQ